MARRAAVIGAGPMGLAVAYELTKRGWPVDVYEQDDRIGGMSAHFDFDGLRIERYYHFICKTDHALFELLEELGLSDRLRWAVTRMGFFYDGVMFEWGRPDALLTFPHLPWVDKLRYAAHLMRARAVPDWKRLDGQEATGWIRRWIGDRAYDVLWRKTFELKFFQHHENISAAWIATRIRRVAMSRRSAFEEEMGYLEGGSETLLQALRERIEAGGGTVRTGAAVQQVEVRDGRVTGVRVGDELRPADVVVSTVPLRFVPRLVPALPDAARESIERLENIGVVCVTVKLSRQLTPYFWVNVNDDRLEIPGLIEYTNLNPLASHVVYVPYYLPADHPKWAWTSDAFLEEVLRYLRIVRPDFDDAWIEATHVSRYKHAQPICPPGFAAALPPMRTAIEGFVMADTSHCYPEDRSITESVRIGHELVRLCGDP